MSTKPADSLPGETREILMLGACLIGIAAGQMVAERSRRSKQAAEASSLVSTSKGVTMQVQLAAVSSGVAISETLTEQLGVERSRTALRSLITFLTAFMLSALAGPMQRRLPGLAD